MDSWKPAGIPHPDRPELIADSIDSGFYETLWGIFRQTYDVTLDDRRLRNDPGSFEYLRGDYPKRREPAAYSVRLFQRYPRLSESLKGLGFSVLAD